MSNADISCADTLCPPKVYVLFSIVYAVIVYHPSVRQFTKMAKHRITQATPCDSAGILSFLVPKISAKFQRVTCNRGSK